MKPSWVRLNSSAMVHLSVLEQEALMVSALFMGCLAPSGFIFASMLTHTPSRLSKGREQACVRRYAHDNMIMPLIPIPATKQ